MKKILSYMGFYLFLFVSPSFVLADAISDFQNNLASYLGQVASGSMPVDSLANNVSLEVMVALKRGADGTDIGEIIVASAPYNDYGINMQLGAVLGAVGAMMESGMIEGENATASDFYNASCDFAHAADFSDEITEIECSK